MIDPKPVGSPTHPRPLRILSKENLRQAWIDLRRRSSRETTAGIDNETAKQFASNLDSNLAEIRDRLAAGKYKFSALRPFFIHKPNSSKERVICVPTIRDRLVQRAIVEYAVSSGKLPISNSSSYGFIRGKGTRHAVGKAVELRSIYDWCIKADIESFFDRIPRDLLKKRVSAALPHHSLTPLIYSVIDCEIRIPNAQKRERLLAQGIRPGTGIRQGMPLSPLLANVMLAKFDRSVEAKRIPMVRYADDLLFFFGSKEEARTGQKFIEQSLASIDLNLSQTKTTLHGPDRTVDFLGREIIFLDGLDKYVARVSRPQIRKIQDKLEREYSYSNRVSKSTLSNTMAELSRSVAAYLGVYRDAHNFPVLMAELEATMTTVLSDLYAEIFGDGVANSLDDAARRFLGLGHSRLPAPSNDLQW